MATIILIHLIEPAQYFSEHKFVTSRPFYAGIESGHCQGAWFFYVENWDEPDINVILRATRDSQLLYVGTCSRGR